MPVLLGREVVKTFRRDKGNVIRALVGISFAAEPGTLTALVGPDGAGKTTLIRLITGLLTADSGELRVLDIDVTNDPQQVQSRIGYMPQRFGLYEDLTVQENLNLYADLHGIAAADRRQRYPRLMEMTGLGPFGARLAGRLSGGMKQKLGLACTLVRSPELLVLDEPTVGVDPLSRKELWQIILQLVREQGLTVLLSTSYLDEAERCGHAIVLHEGKVLAHGPPEQVTQLAAGRVFLADPPTGKRARDLQARLLDEPAIVDAVPMGGRVRFVRAENAAMPDDALRGMTVSPATPRFEDGFMILLQSHRSQGSAWLAGRASDGGLPPASPPPIRLGGPPSLARPANPIPESSDAPIIEVHDLIKRFGNFTAVDRVNFQVNRGEIFGLLGPNGAGKTTTFRMLCGLLAATDGALRVAGVDLRRARASARQNLGYVAQKFSLYGQLTVTENLEFFASAYGLRGPRKQSRINWALDQFELAPLSRIPSGNLPGGFKQRLAMAAALLHEPSTLFLDEPTSGADPPARREFWHRITTLAQQDVTIIITTHFMEEAEYCDHVAIMDQGRILAAGTPAEIRHCAHPTNGREPTMEDAFIAIVEESRGKENATTL